MIALRVLLAVTLAGTLAVRPATPVEPPLILHAQARSAGAPSGTTWFDRLVRWLTAVEAHTAGALDDHAISAAAFGEADLTGIRADLAAVRDRLVRAHQRGQDPTVTYGGRTLPVSEVHQLLGLNEDEGRAGDFNRLLKRAAVLHTDVAYFEPPSSAPPPASSDMRILTFEDGRLVGYDDQPIHWEFARRLLDLVQPTPAADEQVRRWYVATGRVMRRQFSFAHSAPHLSRARRLFADDASLQFLSGCLHEVLAAPRVQSFYRSSASQATGAPVRGRELGRAESFFARAVELAPGLAEARIRLGRVLHLREQHARAADQLQRGLDLAREPALVYLGALFLGDAEQALGHREAAEAAYERARGLYPNAQSAHLALSQLARRRGDRLAALAAAERLFALPPDERSRSDPWWNYHAAAWEPGHALLTEMWGALQETDPP